MDWEIIAVVDGEEAEVCNFGYGDGWYGNLSLDEEPKPEDRALIAAAPEMLAMLKRLEWQEDLAGDPLSKYRTCPLCGNWEPLGDRHFGNTIGHAPDCELAALIAKAEGR